MKQHFPEQTITYYRCRDRHLDSLCRHFPGAAGRLRAFYKEVWETAAVVRTLMKPLPALPPQTAREWTHLLSSLRPAHSRLLPVARATLMDRLRAHELEQETAFVSVLNGQLIDSMQTGAKNVSYLMAATALDVYHEGAYYVEGGLYRIAETLVQSIQENSGIVRKNRRVVRLVKKNRWLATDQHGNEYEADHIVFNAAIQQLPFLTEGLSGRHRAMAAQPTWVTHTLYITLDERLLPPAFPLYQQISTHSVSEGSHLFLSVSAPDDRLRAPAGERTMTVSTHSSPEHWTSKAQ